LELFMNLFNFIINLPLREKRSNLFSLFWFL
jgi:hypothetical protein